MAIQLDEVMIFCISIGSLLFGVFTMFYVATIYILVFKRRSSQRLKTPILAVATTMYIIGLLNVIIEIRRAQIGFIHFGGTPGGATDYFFNTSNPLYLTQKILSFLQTLTGDTFIIYRLYIVWNRNKLVVLPAIVCLAGCLASGIGTLVVLGVASPSTSVFTAKQWVASFFATTLITNGGCTILIALKIWLTERQTSAVFRSRSALSVAIMIVESGAIYSIALVTVLALFLANSWAQYIVLDMVIQLTGIAYSLIIVRVGLSLTSEEATWSSRNSKVKPSFRGHELHNLPRNRNSHTTAIVNIRSHGSEGRPSEDGMANASLGTLDERDESKICPEADNV